MLYTTFPNVLILKAFTKIASIRNCTGRRFKIYEVLLENRDRNILPNILKFNNRNGFRAKNQISLYVVILGIEKKVQNAYIIRYLKVTF